VAADERLYATLIAAAGAAGRLALAFELREEMREDGIMPGKARPGACPSRGAARRGLRGAERPATAGRQPSSPAGAA